jgi:hypothetical protein
MSICKSNISYQLMEIITKPLKVSSLAAEFKAWHGTRRQFRYHASPGMISLGGVCVGRGRVPLHGPTIRQRVRPWHRQSRVVRGITWI